MSKFLAMPTTVEEVEEEVEDDPEFSPHTSRPTFSHILHLPLCHLLVITSLLYQRRVWHIGDPLIGVTIEFLKYDTIIRLYVGWLEDASPDGILSRMHLGSIETSVILDISSPLVSLAVSRLLMSLESPICGVRNGVRNVTGTIAAETQTHTTRSWRIDSDVREDTIRDMPPRTRKPAAVPSVPEIVTPDEGGDIAGAPASSNFPFADVMFSLCGHLGGQWYFIGYWIAE
ncbi:hypothetical protein M404DRAFT_11022 [Pisolithus tinctorius Marx 270]|uniref:Uncharacterized protein n=1 Tax=Pisolithus tinctorius Marx 270 TaxID=870435 RepID=A0A0C3NK70_PISTI|nr:hypothetical protein M404DRAFT_11022 [Pisolithus tinctorius Marx 270]